jgi:hypothetical protein
VAEAESRFLRDSFLLHFYYNTLFVILNEYFKGDLLILDNELNRDYLRICFQISTILKKPEFEHLKGYDWKPYSNLLVFDEYSFEEEWEFEKRPLICNFLTQVESLFIENGEKKYPLDKEEVGFITKIKANLEKYTTYKTQRENELFKRSPFDDFVRNYKKFNNISSNDSEKKTNNKDSSCLISIRDIATLFGKRMGNKNIDFILKPYDIVEIDASNKKLSKIDKIEIALTKWSNNKQKIGSILQSLVNYHSLDKNEVKTLNEALLGLGLHLKNQKIVSVGITGTEPSILQELYEDILEIIYKSGTDIERRVSSHKDRDEPELRDVLLSSLNTHKGLLSSGESFNNKGKTDILVHSGEEIVFIAECKIWRGEASFKQAINQLISLYLTWHDNKTALIIFNRNKGYHQILEKIPAYVKSFTNEYGFSYESLSAQV